MVARPLVVFDAMAQGNEIYTKTAGFSETRKKVTQIMGKIETAAKNVAQKRKEEFETEFADKFENELGKT